MNPYERRIIHAEIQKIEGVSTNSVGSEGNRRVIIFPEGATKPTEAKTERKPAPKRTDRKEKTERREKPAYDKAKTEQREKPATEKSEPRKEQQKEYSYKRPDGPRPAPRKIEKAKDLDSYFAKLKEFSSNNPQ